MFPLSKVNVRTGRKGYYERTQATDKTTAMRIGLHDSDDAIGTDGDLHNRIYSKSTKALNHRDSSIEALDLPFFQLGKHPNQVQPTTAVVQSLPSNPATLAISDVQLARSPGVPPIQNDEDDDDDNEALPSAMNPMQLIHHVIPNMQKQKAEAKAKAAAAKTSAKAKPRIDRKRKHTDTSEKENAPQEKIMRLPAQKPVSGANAGKTEVLESDADRKLVDDFREQMTGVKHSVLAGLGDGDAVVGDNLKKALKDIAALTKKVKEKRKSLKRRQDDGGSLKQEFDLMIDELEKGHQIATKLSQCNGDEDLLTSMKELGSLDWHTSSAMFERAFKSQTLWCLKFSDWAKFTSLRQVMYSEMDVTNGEIFFGCMTSELVQRLLRSLPLRASSML